MFLLLLTGSQRNSLWGEKNPWEWPVSVGDGMNSEEGYSKFLHVMSGLSKWMNPILPAYRSVWRFGWERHTHINKQICKNIHTRECIHTQGCIYIHVHTCTHSRKHEHSHIIGLSAWIFGPQLVELFGKDWTCWKRCLVSSHSVPTCGSRYELSPFLFNTIMV